MTNISINKLHEFKDRPYQVLDNEEMNSLIESVQQQGIMTRLIVRPLENTTDEYEIISGHRRFRAAQKAGLAEVPAFIRPVSRDEAAIMVVDSNLHREHLLPSEKAFAYKLKADALNHQGKRMLAEQKNLETELNRATARNEMLTSLFAKTYEDNVSGKLSDEMYMELSHKYEVERLELKTKIFEYKERLAKISEMEQNKDDFLKAVRKFMEMDSLTAPMLRELIDHIDVYEKEGGKKNYTQRIVIYYRFVGYLELPSSEDENYKANARKGVDVEYIPTAKSA